MRWILFSALGGAFVLSTAVGCRGNDSGAASTSASSTTHQAAAAAPTLTRPLTNQLLNPRELDLDDLVPRVARIHHVWYVAAGRAQPQVVVGWSYRGNDKARSTPSDVRYALTLWHRDRVVARTARWTPQTLFRDSPFPFKSTSIRTADVTRDGRPDLLVTIECNGCNHATAAVSVYATVGRLSRRIYGHGFLDGSKGEHVGVQGRVISETAWGAKRGLIWFDEPRGGSSVCCPAYRLQTFLRWQTEHWRTVATRKVSPTADNFLGQLPVPAP